MNTPKPEFPIADTEPCLLSQAVGEKISAVEGLRLTPRMQALLADTKNLSGDERRRRIQHMLTAEQA